MSSIRCCDSLPQVGQNFIPSSVPNTFAPSPTPAALSSGLNDLFELSTGMANTTGGYVIPKSVSGGQSTVRSSMTLAHSLK